MREIILFQPLGKVGPNQPLEKVEPNFQLLHLCALKMRMEPLLFADENATEWAFSKRKGVKVDCNILLTYSIWKKKNTVYFFTFL